MKHVLLLLSMIVSLSYSYSFTTFRDEPTQDRTQGLIEQQINYLQKLHGDVFSLPYSQDHIRTVLVPEINAQRQSLAPNYPTRESSGNSPELVMQALRTWVATYPAQYNAYTQYLQAYINSHSSN